MANITRIKNNQITDNTIEYTKIKSGTLVGTNFNENITLNSNVTIVGNLNVSGNTSTINSVNTFINDPTVVFNNGYTGSLSGYDIGFIVNRNFASLNSYGSVNTAFVWRENEQAFVAMATSTGGNNVVSLTNSGFANVKVGNLTSNSSTVLGALTVAGPFTMSGATTFTGLTTFNGNVVASNTVYITNTTASTQYTNGALVVAGGVGVGGNLNVFGNITTATGNIITTSSGIFYGNIQTGFGAIYAGIPTGYTVLPQTVSQFTANINSYAQINFQNINGGNAASTDIVVTANNGTDDVHYASFGINSSGYNQSEYSAQGPNDSFLYAAGNTAEPGGNLIISAQAANRRIIFTTGGTATGNIVAVLNAPNTQSTSPVTGSMVVTGGVGISDDLYVGDDAVIGDSLTAFRLNVTAGNITTATVTNLASSNIQVTAGAVTTLYAANFSSPNIVVTGGSVNGTVIGGTTTAAANVTTLNASGTVDFTNTTQSTTTATGALTVDGGVGIAKNLNVGGDVVVTGNLTVQGNSTIVNTEVLNVEDINITLASNAATAAAANGGGITLAGANATFTYTSADDSWNVNKNFDGLSADFSNTTPTTSPTTGALTVRGGVGIGGDLYAYKLNATHANITTGHFGSINTANAAVIGAQTYIGSGASLIANVYAGTGYFTNLSAANISGVTNGNFSTLTTPNFSSANAWITTLNTQTSTLGTVNATSGNITTLNTQTATSTTLNATAGNVTTLVATNFSAGNARITGGFADNYPIGANTAAPGRFTTVTTTGVTTSSGNLVANSQVNSTSSTTGALVVVGGAGIMANMTVGGASTFNSNMTAGFDTVIKGNNDETLIWARAGTVYDQVLIGNSATASTLVVGAKLQINSTDSILLPIGTNAQRPSSSGGTDTQGMFRYNTTSDGPEYYDGSQWNALTTQFTVITSEQFNGDDVTTQYTLAASATTASTIVSINGVIQIPTLAYSVSGAILTFTEAPATGDIIDVRKLTTTTVVTGIASTNGYMQFQVDNDGAYVYTGSSSTTATTYWNTSGAEVSALGNVAVSSANTATAIDSFSVTSYRSAKYTIQATQGSNYQVAEVLVLHNGTTAYRTMYGVIDTNSNVGVTEVTISGGNAVLQYIASGANTNVRIKKTYMII
jgi:hypothetical protein